MPAISTAPRVSPRDYQSICERYGDTLFQSIGAPGIITIMASAFSTSEILNFEPHWYTCSPDKLILGLGLAAGFFAAIPVPIATEAPLRRYVARKRLDIEAGSKLLRRLQFAAVAATVCTGLGVGAAVYAVRSVVTYHSPNPSVLAQK